MADLRRVSSRGVLNGSAGSSGFSCISGSSVYFSSGGSKRKTGFAQAKTMTTTILAIQAAQMIAAPFVNAAYLAHVKPGTTVSGVTISSGGTQLVSSGGQANDTNINDRGYQSVFLGGMATGTIVNSGGNQWIVSGASAAGTIVNSGGKQYIYSGGTATGILQNEGGNVTVSVYGGDTSTIVNGTNASGHSFSYSNGIADHFIIYSGGGQYIENGGIATGTIVNSGGDQWIVSGGTAIGTIQKEGGNVVIDVGGDNMSTVVSGTNASGKTFFYSSGIASNFILYDNSLQMVSNGGSAIDTIVNSHAIQGLAGGGKAIKTTVNSGGSLTVFSGGTATHVIQKEGGNVIVNPFWNGVTFDDSMISIAGTNASGKAFSYSSGIASNFILYSGGSQTISGGSAIGTIINSGANQFIKDGIASGTVINAGFQTISEGGIAMDTIIDSRGHQDILSGGIASKTVIENGLQYVSGIASSTTVNTNGSQFVNNNGSAVDTIVNSGGYQKIYQANASGTIINGGVQFVTNDGTAVDTSLNYGEQIIGEKAKATNTVVNKSAVQTVSKGGVASVTTINGGTQFVGSNASVFSTTVNSGGSQIISGRGTASGTTINSRGLQVVDNNGTASDTMINYEGYQSVSAGGTASGTTVENGGLQTVFEGGTATDTTLDNGGLQIVSSGGIVSNVTLNSGAIQKLAGGEIRGNATYNQGTVLHTQNGTISGNLTFNGGAFRPELDAPAVNTDITTFSSPAPLLAVSGNVTGMAGATIAPVWKANTPLALGSTASFLVLKADSLDSTSGFGSTTKLVKAIYSQRVEGNNELYLDVTGKNAELQNNYASSFSPNASSLAGVLDRADNLAVLPGVMTAIGNLPDDGRVVNHAIDQLSPDVLPTSLLTGVASIRSFQQSLPSAFGQSGKGAQSDNLMFFDEEKPSLKNGTSFFVNPYGSFTNQRSRDRFHGYDLNVGGISFGAVNTLDHSVWFGIAGGYNHQKLDLKGQSSSLEADQVAVSLFAGKLVGSFVLEGGLGYAHSWNDSSRRIDFSGYHAANDGSFSQDFVFGRFNVSYVHTLRNDWRVVPSGGIDAVFARSGGFTESGPDSALKVKSASYHSIEFPIAVQFDKTFKTKKGAKVTPRFSLAWIPQVGDRYGKTTAAFAEAPSAGTFETRSISSDRSHARASVGVDARLTDKWSFQMDYAVDVGSSRTGHNVFASFRKSF